MRVRGNARAWAAIVTGLVVALVVAPLGAPAQAGPGDPNEIWVDVYDQASFDTVAGATVTLYDEGRNAVDTSATDEFGQAGFVGLSAGTYYLGVSATGYVDEYYSESPDLAGASALSVDESLGEWVYMELAAEPQISGTVTGPGGTPLAFADVTVYQYDTGFGEWWDYQYTSTDGAGDYALGGLPDGTYRLGFRADGHVDEYFEDQPDVDLGDDITVAAGGPVVVASAQLAETNQVTGTVTDGSGPVEGVEVAAQQLVEDYGDPYWEDVSYAYTEADGSYSLDVEPGDYRVKFDSGSHLREWWDNAHVADDADLVTVTTADVSGIDAVLDQGGSIAGTVTAFGGAALENAWVTAYRWNAQDAYWEDVASASTGPAGNYSIGNLLGGTYRVGFETFADYLGEYYADAETVEDAADVAVTIGNSTSGIDATLDKAAVIEGTVTGPGITETNLDVSLWERDRYADSGWSESWSSPTIAGTTYRFTGIEPGTYRVRAAAPGLAPEFYADAYEVAQGTDILAERNQTATANLTLAPAPTISGTVTGPTGTLAGADVLIQRKSRGPEGSFWDTYTAETTDAGGNYAADVAPGTYRLRFGAGDHVSEWHDGSATPSRSTQLEVTTSNVDVDAVLDRLGRIVGTVTGPSGAVTGATVSIWRFQSGGDGHWSWMRTATTNTNGSYSVTGLQPGNYRVGFRAAGLQNEFNLDAADVEFADDVAVELNQTETVDAALAPPTRQLSGIVTGSTAGGPVPLGGATVTVERRVVRLDDIVSWNKVAEVLTDASGAWSSPALEGDYRVRFAAPNHVGEWYDDAPTAGDALVVTVADADRTGLDAELAVGGTITGTVTGASTAGPLADAEVYAFMPDGEDDAFAFAGTDGTFTLAGLTPGDWVLQYESDGYISEYFDDQPTVATADRITVTAGSATTADAALAPATEVSGTVTGAGGAGAGDTWVEIHRVHDGGVVDYYDDSALVSDDGTWSADLAPGTYLFEFDPDGDYLPQWYDGAADEASATPVVVGSTAVSGIDAQLVQGGVLAGTVTGPDGLPETDAYVSVYPADATDEWESVWEGFADDDGTYRSDGLPAGSYKLRFETFDGRLQPEYHLDQTTLAAATPVAVALGNETTVNAQLAAYPRMVSGTVTDAQGRGLDAVRVGLYRQVSGAWEWHRSTTSDADGSYDFPVADGTYRVSFAEDDNRLEEWWNDAKTLADATSVLVSGSDRTDIDAQLVDGGVVTGTVTYPPHVSGWSSTVRLYDADTGDWAGQATVDSHQNRYRIDELPAGDYRVEFARTAGFDTAEAEFWNDRPEHTGAGTQTVAVTAGASTTADAVLVEGGILAGTAQDGAGGPLEGCTVSAYTPDGSLVTRTSRVTGPDGTFRVRGLTTGSYRLRVSGGECGFTTLYYDGTGSMTSNSANAVGVAATRGASVAVPPLVVPTGGTIVNTAPPTINDTTPEVGQTLTATPGTWSETGLAFAYAWLADGVPIVGATSSSYVVAAGDADKALAVRVTASKAGFVDGVATSAATADVVATDPPLANTAPPAISDTTPVVGQTVNATTGTWSETAGVTYAYQWTSDGADITGATGPSYTVPAGQLGRVLRVRVTASKAGFASGSATSAATSPVAAGTITNTTPPTVDDLTPSLGVQVAATTGTWSETAGVTYAYQWFRGVSEISGATAKTYTPVAADVGLPLRVRVTASKAGYTDGAAQSAQTSPVADPSLVITSTAPPTVDDTTPAVGQAVTATTGSWSETAGVTYAYQWFRGASAIGGATAKTYTPVAADVGQPLRVRVTATKAGYTGAQADSAPTEPVAKGTIAAPKPKVTGKPKVGKVLTVTLGSSTPTGVKVTYQWLRNGKAIKRAKKSTYKLTKKDRRTKISVRVTRTAPGYTKLVLTSGATRKIR